MKQRICALALTLAMAAALALPAAASGQNTVHVSTAEELSAALKSNTTIELEGKDYSCSLFLSELENVTLKGTGSTRILSPYNNEVIIFLYECKNVTLDGLVLGHDVPAEVGCTEGVVNLAASDVTIRNCDIFGCGVLGIDAYGSTISMSDSTIRDCSDRIIGMGQTTAVFDNCTFSGNDYEGYQTEAVYYNESSATFHNCVFKDNQNPVFTHSETLPVFDNCTFLNNAWPDPADTSGSSPAPAAKTAYASTQEIEVDGQKVTFEAYALKDANGNDTNYIKLRDVASVLNGTAAQFEVGWNGSVTITTGQAYTPNGSEMSTPYSGNRAYKDASAATVVNGSPVQLSAILLTDDSGNGYTYYKLRDLGEALGFKVDWTAERGIFIETN